MQYRGRQMNTWSEVVYDGRGYRISQSQGNPQAYVVKDQVGDLLLSIENGNPMKINLERPIPVHLIILVALRIIEESQFTVI
jgi:hypothetical protein